MENWMWALSGIAGLIAFGGMPVTLIYFHCKGCGKREMRQLDGHITGPV